MPRSLHKLWQVFLEPAALWHPAPASAAAADADGTQAASPAPPAEEPTLWQALFPLGFVTAAIPAIAQVIGRSIIGQTLGPFGVWRLPLWPAIGASLLLYALLLAGLLGLGAILRQLARALQAERPPSYERAVSWASVLTIPLFVGGLFLLYSEMTPLWFLAGLWGVVLLKNVGQHVLGVPATRAWQYAVASFAIYYLLLLGLSHVIYLQVTAAFTPSIADMLQHSASGVDLGPLRR